MRNRNQRVHAHVPVREALRFKQNRRYSELCHQAWGAWPTWFWMRAMNRKPLAKEPNTPMEAGQDAKGKAKP